MSPSRGALGAADLVAWLAGVRSLRLENGLLCQVLANRQAPLVTTALAYRVGTRDEPPGQGGIAHFLEHMMFKGSRRFGPGEIDRLTQTLGGSNNAFTGHDLTAYHFSFAADRWQRALEVEVDRMLGLRLEPSDVASEREVIIEEIAMYDDEPWDALERDVVATLFSGHAYGRPVLGSATELATTGAAELAAFHERFYGPDNAVLTVAGDLGESALAAVVEAFGALPARGGVRGAPAPVAFPTAPVRLTRHQGEVPRLLVAFPAPAATAPEHSALRLVATLLGSGRASRLHRALVDERSLCLGVSVHLAEQVGQGYFAVGAEAMPGVEPARVEEALLAELARLRETVPSGEELERSRRVLAADWVFSHERIHHQALSAAVARALFDLDHPGRELAGALSCNAEAARATAATWLDPARGSVVGWSLP